MKKFILFSWLFSASNLFAGELSLGMGYPYLSCKYGLSHKISLETRGAFGQGIKIFSGRGYYNFYSNKNILGFGGIEGGYITFDTEGLEGKGFLAMPFVGGEYFIRKNFSVSIDMGAGFIGLETDKESFSVSGLEWIANMDGYQDFEQEIILTEESLFLKPELIPVSKNRP